MKQEEIKIRKKTNFFISDTVQIFNNDALKILKSLPDKSVQMAVTSPPYFGLKDYGIKEQIGLEQTPQKYINKLVRVFRELRRVLKDDGVFWLNIGDSFYNYRPGKGQSLPKQTMSSVNNDLPQICPRRANKFKGIKEKELIGIPWMLAFALREDGWYLRMDVIWNKPHCKPESVKDRPTLAHEYFFMFTKNKKYYYDQKHLMEKSVGNDSVLKNKRSVWNIPAKKIHKEAHFATYPSELIEQPILACSREGDIIIDPFAGSGTTGYVCKKLNRKSILIEINKNYCNLITKVLNLK